MAAYLEVTALLDITLNGSKIALRGAGTRLEADLPDLRTALLMKRRLKSSFSQLNMLLRSNGLVLNLKLQSAEIGRIGNGARPNLMGWLAGCAGLELHIFRFVWAVSKSLLGSEHASKQ